MASFKAVNASSTQAGEGPGGSGIRQAQAVERHEEADLNDTAVQRSYLDGRCIVPVVPDQAARTSRTKSTGASKRASSKAAPQKRKSSKATLSRSEPLATGSSGVHTASIDDAFPHQPVLDDDTSPIVTHDGLQSFRHQTNPTLAACEGGATPVTDAAIFDPQAPPSNFAFVEGLELFDLPDDDVAISDNEGKPSDNSDNLPDVEAAWLDDLVAAMDEDDEDEFAPSIAPPTTCKQRSTTIPYLATQPSTPHRPSSPQRPVTPTRPKSSPLSSSMGAEKVDLSSSNGTSALRSTPLSSPNPNMSYNPHHWSLTPPIVRPPFPSPVQARSPITGLSSSCLLRTCFRIGEALNAGCQAARTGQNVLLELYARVISSYREVDGGQETGKQYFQFADLFSDRGPVLQGYWEGWKGVGLWEDDGAAFLCYGGGEEDEGFDDVDVITTGTAGTQKQREARLCRAMGRMTREGRQWIFAISSIWQAGWEDVEYVRGIVCA